MNLTPAAARERFAGARVATLATIAPGGAPRLVPVTFALLADGATDLIVTAVDHKPKRTTRLARLDDIARDGRVSLLADAYDDDWSRLWWARAEGVARVASPGTAGHTAAVRALAARYPQYREHPPAGPAIEIEVRRWSGWSYR
ncbi:MAG: TIGR03668 family PPOX class F420-dependent oxidoreductase [Frankia sp.]|nr:TIGR03668 family PPOX class F420-dependent oxidoreductase [Frankia sp.]